MLKTRAPELRASLGKVIYTLYEYSEHSREIYLTPGACVCTSRENEAHDLGQPETSRLIWSENILNYIPKGKSENLGSFHPIPKDHKGYSLFLREEGDAAAPLYISRETPFFSISHLSGPSQKRYFHLAPDAPGLRLGARGPMQ